MSNGISLYSQTLSGLIIGIMTFIISQFTFIPQFIKLVRTKNTSGISLFAYAIYTFAYVFYVIWAYGLYFNNIQSGVDPSVPIILYKASLIPVVVTNSTALVLMSIIFSIKLRHVVLAKKLKVSELKLADILLKKEKNSSFWKKYWVLFVVLFVDIIIILTVILCLTYLTDVNHTTHSGEQWIWVTVANLICACSAEIMVWSQMIKTLKSKDTSGISLFWAIFIPLTSITFFTYTLYLGFARGGEFYWPVICSLVLNGFIPGFTTLGFKIHNYVKAKKLGISEKKYIELQKQHKN